MNSCVKKDSNIVKPIEYSVDFEKYRDEDRLVIIDLDSIENYSELRMEMGRITCNEKVSGLKINTKTKVHYITGFASCPTSGVVSCYFRRNLIMIKNDSIINHRSINPIENLKIELDSIMSKSYNFQYNKEILKPALIYLYMDDDVSVSAIKRVLGEIAEQFQKIRINKGPDYFKYHILFEDMNFLEVKPPPPPPPLVPEKIEIVE